MLTTKMNVRKFKMAAASVLIWSCTSRLVTKLVKIGLAEYYYLLLCFLWKMKLISDSVWSVNRTQSQKWDLEWSSMPSHADAVTVSAYSSIYSKMKDYETENKTWIQRENGSNLTSQFNFIWQSDIVVYCIDHCSGSMHYAAVSTLG